MYTNSTNQSSECLFWGTFTPKHRVTCNIHWIDEKNLTSSSFSTLWEMWAGCFDTRIVCNMYLSKASQVPIFVEGLVMVTSKYHHCLAYWWSPVLTEQSLLFKDITRNKIKRIFKAAETILLFMFGSTTQGKSYIYDKNHGVILQKMAAVLPTPVCGCPHDPSLWLPVQKVPKQGPSTSHDQIFSLRHIWK